MNKKSKISRDELIKKFIRFFKFKHRCYYIFDKYDTDNSYTVDEKGVTVVPSLLTELIASRELAKNPGASIIQSLILYGQARPVLVIAKCVRI